MKVKDATVTSPVSLADYPINWSAIKNKTINWNDIKNVSVDWSKVNRKKALKVFGYVLGSPDSEDQQEVRPAVAVGYADLGDLDTFQISTVVCVANDGAWTKLSVADNNKFISL